MNNLVYVQSLLEGGANPCSTDSDGLTALHFAAFAGHHAVLCLLLSNDIGTDMDTGERLSCLDMRSDCGYTPLMMAVYAGGSTVYGGCGKGTGEEMFCVRELVMSGAAIDAMDNLGRTAKDIAREVENVEAYEYLELEPPTEEAIAETRRANKERDEVKRTPNFVDMDSCPRDPVTGKIIVSREDKLPIPPELNMPEHHIYPFAKKNFQAKRKDGVGAIRNLVKVKEQAEINEVRRQFLANSIEYNLRKKGLMN